MLLGILPGIHTRIPYEFSSVFLREFIQGYVFREFLHEIRLRKYLLGFLWKICLFFFSSGIPVEITLDSFKKFCRIFSSDSFGNDSSLKLSDSSYYFENYSTHSCRNSYGILSGIHPGIFLELPLSIPTEIFPGISSVILRGYFKGSFTDSFGNS